MNLKKLFQRGPDREKMVHKGAKSMSERRNRSRTPHRVVRPHLRDEVLHSQIQRMLREVGEDS